MTTQQREWDETIPAEVVTRPGTWLWVADEYVGHASEVGDGDTVESLLADYAASYNAREVGDRIAVRWILVQGGEEADRGRHTFSAVLA